jgi:hypothetical protein
MNRYRLTVSLEFCTDAPVDPAALTKAIEFHYVDNGEYGRYPLALESVRHWLAEMARGAVRAAAYDPIWNGPPLPGEEDFANWPGGVNPRNLRACEAAKRTEEAAALCGMRVVLDGVNPVPEGV